MPTHKEIEELNKLSKEVFGRESKWRKLVEKGEGILVTEETKKLTLDGKVEKTEIVRTPVMHVGPNDGELATYVLKRYTIEEVRAKMLDLKEKIMQARIMYAKEQEDRKKAEEAKKFVASMAGSASV